MREAYLAAEVTLLMVSVRMFVIHLLPITSASTGILDFQRHENYSRCTVIMEIPQGHLKPRLLVSYEPSVNAESIVLCDHTAKEQENAPMLLS